MDDFGAERIDHVTILVTDLDKGAGTFTRACWGFARLPRPPSFDFPGMWFKTGPSVPAFAGENRRRTPPVPATFATG